MLLCVPGNKTSFSRRPHSSFMPLQPAVGVEAAAGCWPRWSTKPAVTEAVTAVSAAIPAMATARR